MARIVFTQKQVDAMIEAAVAKATAPLLERIAALEAELAKAKKELLELFQAAFQRSGQTAQAAAKGRPKSQAGRATRP
jgi:hypothetical protein